MAKQERKPPHEHTFNSKEGFATKDKSIFVTLVCNFKMKDGAWCGERSLLMGQLLKTNYRCGSGMAYYGVYTGGDDYWLIIETAFEDMTSSIEIIKGIALVRG